MPQNTINAQVISEYLGLKELLNQKVFDVAKYVYTRRGIDYGDFNRVYENSWAVADGAVVADICWYAGCGSWENDTIEFPVSYLYEDTDLHMVVTEELEKAARKAQLAEQLAKEAVKKKQTQEAIKARHQQYQQYLKLREEFENVTFEEE